MCRCFLKSDESAETLQRCCSFVRRRLHAGKCSLSPFSTISYRRNLPILNSVLNLPFDNPGKSERRKRLRAEGILAVCHIKRWDRHGVRNRNNIPNNPYLHSGEFDTGSRSIFTTGCPAEKHSHHKVDKSNALRGNPQRDYSSYRRPAKIRG